MGVCLSTCQWLYFHDWTVWGALSTNAALGWMDGCLRQCWHAKNTLRRHPSGGFRCLHDTCTREESASWAVVRVAPAASVFVIQRTVLLFFSLFIFVCCCPPRTWRMAAEETGGGACGAAAFQDARCDSAIWLHTVRLLPFQWLLIYFYLDPVQKMAAIDTFQWFSHASSSPCPFGSVLMWQLFTCLCSRE